MIKKLWLLPCLLALFLSGCAGLGANRTEVLLKQGETYTILLDENPTTGYRWSVFLLDLRVVSIVESTYIPPGGELMGAPGVRKIVVKGELAGQGELELHNVRSWENNQEPEDKRLYLFKVYR
jgi:predicted secreted protein